MRTLFVLLVGILFSMGSYAQLNMPMSKDTLRDRVNFVIHGDSLHMKKMKYSLKNFEYSLTYFNLRLKRTKSDVQEMWGWLLDAALCEDVKRQFDLSPRLPLIGGSFSFLANEEAVGDQLKIEFFFNEHLELLEMHFMGKHLPNIFEVISDEQLETICKEIVKRQMVFKEVFRIPTPAEREGECVEKGYRTEVYVNGGLKWGETRKTKEPERWEEICNRFDAIMKQKE